MKRVGLSDHYTVITVFLFLSHLPSIIATSSITTISSITLVLS